MISELLAFLAAAILLTLSPGPDILYVLVQGMSVGARRAFMTALGLVSGILVHTSLVALGVSAIVRDSSTLYFLIRFLGAAYLFYLSYQVWRSDAPLRFEPEVRLGREGAGKLFFRGFLMNVLNPKVAIFFLALFPGFLWDPKSDPVFQFYLLGLIFMIQALLIFGAVALLAGRISRFLQRHEHAGVFLKWLQVVVLLLIGIYILWP